MSSSSADYNRLEGNPPEAPEFPRRAHTDKRALLLALIVGAGIIAASVIATSHDRRDSEATVAASSTDGAAKGVAPGPRLRIINGCFLRTCGGRHVFYCCSQ